MSINIGPPVVDELKPKIAVIGVGGAGGNAIANMIAAKVEGVDFIVANTDAQALNASPAEHRIQLGPDITQGLGAGSRPEVGRAAAEETIEQVERALDGAHMCFIAAGMGGGTGTGAAPVIAAAARARNILTVGVVTKPFHFEGTRRMRSADAGIDELQKNVDTLIVIPNQNLFLVANPNTTFKEAFLLADEVLQQGVRGITDLMVMPGLINLDFADVRSVMHEMGKAMMGTGEADGDNRALEAAEKAIANPLLDGVSLNGAKGVIVSIVGGEDMRLMEVDEAANHIRELVDPDANIIWGSAFNPALDGRIRVSVVATGIESDGSAASPAAARSGSAQTGFGGFAGLAPAATRPQPAPPIVEAEQQPRDQAVETDTLELDGAAVEAEPAPAAPVRAEWNSPAGASPARAAPPAAPTTPSPAAPAQPVKRFNDLTGVDDELDLGSVGQAEGTVGAPAPTDTSSPTAPAGPGFSSTADPSLGGSSPLVQKSPRPSGGTLFERMSNLSRGLTREDEKDEGDDGGVALPRFLNRQNNP